MHNNNNNSKEYYDFVQNITYLTSEIMKIIKFKLLQKNLA
jgi:hypothetical protein